MPPSHKFKAVSADVVNDVIIEIFGCTCGWLPKKTSQTHTKKMLREYQTHLWNIKLHPVLQAKYGSKRV